MNRFDENSPKQAELIGGASKDSQHHYYQRNLIFERKYGQADQYNFEEQDYSLAEQDLNIDQFQQVEYNSKKEQNPCRQHCIQNIKSVKRVVDQLLQRKYEGQFTFYFSKPINELLSNSPTHHVVLFKEYLFIDDENEYLKRFYFSHENQQRLGQLLQFYQAVFPPCQPNLYALDVASIMIKRNNALDKIFFIENERKMLQPPETQREQIPLAQEDLYLESHSSLTGQQLDNLNDFEKDNKHAYYNDIIELGNQYLHSHHQKFDKLQEENNNKNDEEFQLESNYQAIEYYNDDLEGINLYSQNVKHSLGSNQQQVSTPQQKNTQKQRSRDAELKKIQYQKHSPRNNYEMDPDEAKIDTVEISTPRKDLMRTKSHSSQAQRELHYERRDERKKSYKNKDQNTPRTNSEGLFCETPRDTFKFNQQKLKESPEQQDYVREAFMLANSNSQKRNKEQQRREWDAQNRPLHKNFKNEIEQFNHEEDLQNLNEKNQNNIHNFQFGDEEDVEEMFNILHQQDQKNQNQLQKRRKTTDSEFEDALAGGQNDFSLHSHEFMDNKEDFNEEHQQYFENQKFYQDFGMEDSQFNQYNNNNNNIYRESDNNFNEVEDDYQQQNPNQEDNLKCDNLFGQGSFMKDLNEYELEISYQTDSYDVYNPSFSSQQSQSQQKSILRQEEELYQEVWDIKDIDDIMERYVVGKDESGYVCRCNEFAQNKENIKNILFEEQEKAHSSRRQNGNEERGILRQQNSQINKNSDNSDINFPKMALSNDITQLKKTNSTSMSQVKNHSSTPSNQNNYPSSSSMKSSHHHHQQQQSLQPEDYQYLILQQSLQQQIQQQQQNIQNNPQQKSKSSLKQQRSSEIPKCGVDLSPRNHPYVLDLNELSPNYQKTNQNFNEMLQTQIQNQIAIKQKLEQQKAENSTSNKMIEQNQQYYSNYSAKGENTNPQQQHQQLSQNQQLHQSSSSNTLGSQPQQYHQIKNVQNSNTSLANNKNMNYQNVNNTSTNNNVSNNTTNQLLMQQLLTTNSSTSLLQQSKPIYNNTKKKLANQLQAQNNNNQQHQTNTSQSKNVIRQNDFYQGNIQQSNSLQGQFNQNNQIADASSNSLMAGVTQNGQLINEIGNAARSKFFDSNQFHHTKKYENSSTYNTLDSTKKPISSLIEQSSQVSHSHINQHQHSQSSKLKSNPNSNNNGSATHNLLSTPSQPVHSTAILSGLTQQLTQTKSNVQSSKNVVNSSTQNLKNNQSKGLNVSPQHQLDMLTMNQSPQQGFDKSQQYKAFNQITQQYSNNQSKLEPKNIASSLVASTSSSQKGISSQQHYQQVTTQHNAASSSKGRAKMHGKEKRNSNANQSNPGSISLTNIKKQSFLNQIDPPLYNNQQTNSLVKSIHNPHLTDSQQLEIVQYFQSSGSDPNPNNKFLQNNLLQAINDKKNEQSQSIFGSPVDKLEQQQHYQYISPPQKRQIEKPSTQLLGVNRFSNKSISHSTNLFQKEEGIRNSQAMQSNGHKRNSLKKSSELIQGVGNSTTDINWHPILMKQGSKDQIVQKTTDTSNSKSQHPILVQNSLSKSSALNIEVQRRISLKHLKIKENNHFLGLQKNISIDKDPVGVGQSRLDETNLSKKQNSIKLSQKRFPHLNNSVGDPSPLDMKQEASNAASGIDSNREMQYSNNPHHNQIVQSLLSLNQINPHSDQQSKKQQVSSNKNNQHNNNQYAVESASKKAINIYSQNMHKNTSSVQNQPTNNTVSNSINYSKSFVHNSNYINNVNNNQTIGGNGQSQSNSRLSSQEKMFSRPSKNKSLDENIKKKINQNQQGQQVSLMQNNKNLRQQQQSPSNSLPHQQYQQYYYPQTSASQQLTQTQTIPPPMFMSPQLNYSSTTPLNQLNSINGIQNRFSIDNSHTPLADQNLPYLQHNKQFNLDCEATQVNQNQMTLQQKNRNKQNLIPFNQQISSSLQQSQNLTHQYKTSAPNQQSLAVDLSKIDNQLSSPRFKKIKSKEILINQQNHEQQLQNPNQAQNISASQSSTPSQSNISNQQQHTATFNNNNEKSEKEKQTNIMVTKNPKQTQKKQLLHHSHSTNINNIKKNNFLKQQEILRSSQQQHTSIGDGVSQNSSYGFLTSRSMKKSQKEGQNGQKMNIQDSPYNMDGIKRETNKILQQQQNQQQQQSNQNSYNPNTNLLNISNQAHAQKQSNSTKQKPNKLNQITKAILSENQEEAQSSSRQESTNNNEINKLHPNNQLNMDLDDQDQQYQLFIQHQQQQQQQNPNQQINSQQIDQFSQQSTQSNFYNGILNQINTYTANQHLPQNQMSQQSQQTNETYYKIKNDLKQNALDIIKTQKRKK